MFGGVALWVWLVVWVGLGVVLTRVVYLYGLGGLGFPGKGLC